MKSASIQSSFIAGQIDVAAAARSETAMYRNAAKGIVNGQLLATGGVLSRWGSAFISDVDVLPGTPVRLEEFSFSFDQSYMAVFTEGGASFWYAQDGGAAGLVVGPWTAAMVPGLRFAQAGDTMFIVHPDMYPQMLIRTGAASWLVQPLLYTNGTGPVYRYVDDNVSLTYTAAGTYLSASEPIWTVDHVDTLIRVYDTATSTYRYGYLTAFLNVFAMTVVWRDTPVADGNVSTLWQEGAFSTARGFARSVCIYQQRLIFGGSRDAGDAVWMSRIARYFDFDLGAATDADAIAIALGTTRVRTIQHTVAGPQLTFLTESAALYMPETDTRPLTPGSLPKVRVVGAFGAGDVRPGIFDGGVLMVQVGGHSVRDIGYSAESDNLMADPISLTVTDTLGTVVDSAYLPGSLDRPEQYAFFVTEDGRLMVFHSAREQKVSAWAQWTTAGAYRAIGQAGGVLYAVVERLGVLCFERFDPALTFDSSLVLTAPFVAPHLPGVALHARLGDAYFGQGMSSGAGAVTITGVTAGQLAEVGLAFDWWIDPLPPSYELPDGPLLARPQRLMRVGLRLYRARAASFGAVVLVLRDDDMIPTTPEPSYDGWWHVTRLGYARRGDETPLCPRISRNIPMPVGVLAYRREIALWA